MPVEYFRRNNFNQQIPSKIESVYHQMEKGDQVKENYSKHFQTFLLKLNSWNSSLNVTQPPPSHLKYQYPPPTPAVLQKICNTLASVPKFYTQVLHLMNKMNLPCPFQSIQFPEPEMPIAPEVSSHREKRTSPEMSSEDEETELESDEEGPKLPDEIIPTKRLRPQNSKKVKRPKFIKSTPSIAITATKAVKPEEVFEKVVCEPVQRKIELKLVSTSEATLSTGKTDESTLQTSGSFGLMFPVNVEPQTQQNEESRQETTDEGSTITEEELSSNRVSSKDQKHLPVYKNYQPGIPSCRLYIKNLSKQVTERDLHYIYGRFMLPEQIDQSGMFNVQLMKEGRMKGQAFITLQSVKQAEIALKETNGYILKDKPMVVQFARSAPAK